jgi:hypothetical protein
MQRNTWMATAALLVAGLSLGASASWADFEVDGPDGRKILLKDDGTWRYVDVASQAAKAGAEKNGEAVLSLMYRKEAGPNCVFGVKLVNNLSYEIRNIVPTFSVYRPNGVRYDSKTLGFFSLKPGNSQERKIEFRRITCGEIEWLQVSGGDRCSMEDLTRFSPETGECLSRIRVEKSDLLRFDK